MALKLNPFQSILSAIASPFEDAGKAIGDAGSYVAGAVTGNQQAQHNASTAFGNAMAPIANIVEAPVRAGVGAGLGLGTDFYNVTHNAALTTPQFLQQQNNPSLNALDTYATNHNKNENLSKGLTLAGNAIQAGSLFGFGPEAGALEGVLGGQLAKTGLSDVTKSLLAKSGAKIGAGAATGANFGAGQALTAPNPTVGSVATGAGEGAAVGGVYGGLNKASAKLVGNGINALDEATKAPVADATPIEAPKQVAKMKQPDLPEETKLQLASGQATPAVVPEGQIAVQGVPKFNTGIPEIDKAATDYAAEQSRVATYQEGDAAGTARGQSEVGQIKARALGDAITHNLSKDENRMVEDYLDTGKAPEGFTPNALKVANVLSTLRERDHAIRQAVDPDIGKVANYSPRIGKGSARDVTEKMTGGGDPVLGKVRSLDDIFNIRSRYSQARQLDKFIGKNGTQYGTPQKLGLKDIGDGKYQDASGQIFTRQHASKQELTDAGQGSFERASSQVTRVYGGDTLSLKARAEALQALQADPQKFGLYTQDQVAQLGMKNVQPITRIAELKPPTGDYYYAAKDVADRLEQNLGYHSKQTPAGLAMYDALTNIATKLIVLNPLFHGMNQLYQTAIAAGNIPGAVTGWGAVMKNMFDQNQGDVVDFFRNPANHTGDFGKSMENIASKVTKGTTKIPSKMMYAMELRMRVALYKTSLDHGMSPKAAADNINRFLGDDKAINDTVRRTILFAHYFRTMAGAMKAQVTHPIKNIGANVNTVLLLAMTAAMSYGYQKLTGNPNAKVRLPGELGLANQAVGSIEDIAAGKLPSILTNRINPVLKEGIQQITNKDLFTGKQVGNTVQERLGHAVGTLASPENIASKITSGKRSTPEVLTNELGLSTPHARGYQAAPNLSVLNTPGAIRAKYGDPTGYQQEQAYFRNSDALHRTFSNDTVATDILNRYLDRSHDPSTGQSIKMSPNDEFSSAGSLSTNPKVLAGLQKFEKSQPSHDPMWDLPLDAPIDKPSLEYLMTYKAQLEGSAERNNLKDNAGPTGNNWITNLEKAQQDYYNNLPQIPGSKPSEANTATPPYPSFDKQTEDLLAAYDTATTDQRSALEKQYGPELSTAFNQIAQWTNLMRKAQTGKDTPQLNVYPEASPQVQAILNTYNSLPKGDGKKGGSPERAAWIKANPDAYSAMQNYLTQTSMFSLIKNAALAQFQGTKASQQLLKDIKNVGQYDIASTKNADGTTTYAINPKAAYAQSSGSGSSSSSSFSKYAAKVKQSAMARDAEHSVKALKRGQAHFQKAKKGQVFIKGAPKVNTKKIRLAGVEKHFTPQMKPHHAPTGKKVKLKV